MWQKLVLKMLITVRTFAKTNNNKFKIQNTANYKKLQQGIVKEFLR